MLYWKHTSPFRLQSALPHLPPPQPDVHLPEAPLTHPQRVEGLDQDWMSDLLSWRRDSGWWPGRTLKNPEYQKCIYFLVKKHDFLHFSTLTFLLNQIKSIFTHM